MSAILLVATGLVAIVVGFVLFRRRGWWALAGLTVMILGGIAALATAPQAWVQATGRQVQGVVAELEERAAARQRRGWWGEERSFFVRVCYRAPEPLRFGVDAPLSPLVGDDPMTRACASLPGEDPARLSRVRYAEAEFDRLRIGMPVTLRAAQIGGLVELAYPIDAPVLPWVPRPRQGSGTVARARAEVVSVSVQERGVSQGGGRGGSHLPVPIAHVRFRFTPQGYPAPVEAIDQVDADWRQDLAAGTPLDVSYDTGKPRDAWITDASRRHGWRNGLEYVLMFGIPVLLVIAGLWWWRRKKAAARA